MELWIRSQDKEKIFKSDGLMIYCTCEEMSSTASYEICDSFEGSIATYKSKERALEVLDEIEKTIINIGLPWNEQNKKIAIGRHIIFNMVSQLAIYEMPKE